MDIERRILLTSSGIKPEVQPELRHMMGTIKHKPIVAYIPRVADDGKHDFTERGGSRWLRGQNCIIINVNLDPIQPAIARKTIEPAEIIYVGGGNIYQLLDLLRRTEVDQSLIEKVNSGCLFIGASAAAMIAGPTIEPALKHPRSGLNYPGIKNFEGLNIVPDIIWPHFQPSDHLQIHRLSYSYESLISINDRQAVVYHGQSSRIVGAPYTDEDFYKEVCATLTVFEPLISKLSDPNQRLRAKNANYDLKGFIKEYKSKDRNMIRWAREVALAHLPGVRDLILAYQHEES